MSRNGAVATLATLLIAVLVVSALVLADLAGSDNGNQGSVTAPQPAGIVESTATVSPPLATTATTATPSPTLTLESPSTSSDTVVPPHTPEPTPALEATTTPMPEGNTGAEPLIDRPVRISIPAIDVDTMIEWVGLDSLGNMDVPSGYDTTAWFERGTRPGITGNAVIAGHLDSRTGPAVFFRLEELQPGDEITVTTGDGQVLVFRVDRLAAFQADDAPRYEIFGPSSNRNLNLITCSGIFDATARAYDERLVVYSTLVPH